MAKLDISITAMEPEEIKNDLIAQLKAKGADVAVFEDLIDRYLFYRELEIEMQRDIAERGLCYPSVSATGKEYVKDNPSVKGAVMYNKQCLAILSQLELSPKTVVVTDGGDDDDL